MAWKCRVFDIAHIIQKELESPFLLLTSIFIFLANEAIHNISLRGSDFFSICSEEKLPGDRLDLCDMYDKSSGAKDIWFVSKH